MNKKIKFTAIKLGGLEHLLRDTFFSKSDKEINKIEDHILAIEEDMNKLTPPPPNLMIKKILKKEQIKADRTLADLFSGKTSSFSFEMKNVKSSSIFNMNNVKEIHLKTLGDRINVISAILKNEVLVNRVRNTISKSIRNTPLTKRDMVHLMQLNTTYSSEYVPNYYMTFTEPLLIKYKNLERIIFNATLNKQNTFKITKSHEKQNYSISDNVSYSLMLRNYRIYQQSINFKKVSKSPKKVIISLESHILKIFYEDEPPMSSSKMKRYIIQCSPLDKVIKNHKMSNYLIYNLPDIGFSIFYEGETLPTVSTTKQLVRKRKTKTSPLPLSLKLTYVMYKEFKNSMYTKIITCILTLVHKIINTNVVVPSIDNYLTLKRSMTVKYESDHVNNPGSSTGILHTTAEDKKKFKIDEIKKLALFDYTPFKFLKGVSVEVSKSARFGLTPKPSGGSNRVGYVLYVDRNGWFFYYVDVKSAGRQKNPQKFLTKNIESGTREDYDVISTSNYSVYKYKNVIHVKITGENVNPRAIADIDVCRAQAMKYIDECRFFINKFYHIQATLSYVSKVGTLFKGSGKTFTERKIKTIIRNREDADMGSSTEIDEHYISILTDLLTPSMRVPISKKLSSFHKNVKYLTDEITFNEEIKTIVIMNEFIIEMMTSLDTMDEIGFEKYKRTLIGYIATKKNQSSIQIGNMLGLFHVPVLRYATTGNDWYTCYRHINKIRYKLKEVTLAKNIDDYSRKMVVLLEEIRSSISSIRNSVQNNIRSKNWYKNSMFHGAAIKSI